MCYTKRQNPSTSLLNALKAHHTVYINRYISFFNDLPLKVGFITNPLPGHNVMSTFNNNTTPIMSYWDYALVVHEKIWTPLFPKLNKNISCVSPELDDLLYRISITLFWSYDDDDDDFLC